ncbi:MAG: hypothetical protein AB7I19_00265 [Planctomycetota bacterium]
MRWVVALLALLLFAAVASGWWLARHGEPELAQSSGRRGDGAAEDVSERATVDESDSSRTNRSSALAVPDQVVRLLEDGDFDECRIRWITGSDVAAIHRPLHSSGGIEHRDWFAPEQARIVVPHGHWVWLCAQFRFAATWRTRYFRAAPGAEVLRLDCRREAPAQIWIRAIDRSLQGASGGRRLIARSGSGESITVSLDSRGLGVLDAHLRGVISLSFPDASQAADGSASSVLVDRVSPHDAHVLTLGEPEETFAVPLDLMVAGETAALRSARVTFRRVDGSGELIPLLARLQPGHFSAVCPLPRGTYVIESVPPGALRGAVEDGLLRVPRDGGAVAVRVEGQPASVALELVGLISTDFPVRVRWIERGAAEGVHSDLEHVGPYHWNRPIEQVHALASEGLIVVSGRQGFWLSPTSIKISGPSTRAQLQPAAEVEFSWVDGPASDRRLAILSADRVAFLTRRWVSSQDLSAPAWLGRLVLPAGDCAIECIDHEGVTVYSENLLLRPGRHRIALRGMPPMRLP